MILHVVLFEPRSDLHQDDRIGLANAMTTALREIPSVRRSTVGRRVMHGAGYEALMQVPYSYCAMLAFDDRAGLEAYLAHPAHEALAARFFAVAHEMLLYDFDVAEGVESVQRLI